MVVEWVPSDLDESGPTAQCCVEWVGVLSFRQEVVCRGEVDGFPGSTSGLRRECSIFPLISIDCVSNVQSLR